MLKQGVVQETMAELNAGTSVLPPLHNLPHWSRVNNFDKTRYPKPFLKDRLQPLPNTNETDSTSSVTGQGYIGTEPDEEPPIDASHGMNQGQRMVHLEKSINFLQHQHHEVLSSLHEEIDKLKRDNKELQFKIVMIQRNPQTPASGKSRTGSRGHRPKSTKESGDVRSQGQADTVPPLPHPPSGPKHGAMVDSTHDLPPSEHQSQASDEKLEELKIIFLEEEIKDLTKALKEERNRNHQLQQLLDHAERRLVNRSQVGASAEPQIRSAGPRPQNSNQSSVIVPPAAPGTSAIQGHDPLDTSTDPPNDPLPHTPPSLEPVSAKQPLPFNATLNPLTVYLPGQPTRAPTSKESEVIIKHLQRLNDTQAHELNQLKSDLRDVLYSHKWTPDAYLLAKAYVAEDDAREMAEQSRFPKIPMRQSSRKVPDLGYLRKDTLALPAMKHTMGNKAIERRKRTQILQRSRITNSSKEVAN